MGDIFDRVEENAVTSLVKIRFGILTPQMSRDYQKILKTWTEADSYGFDSAWIVDHLIPYDYPNRPLTEFMLECWVTLSALARDTKTIRFGPLVSCNSYRQPQLLAKMSASLDVISNGRLNFGLGAGWLELEHEAYGYPFPSTLRRIERLDEAITVIKLMWTEKKTTYTGQYYAVKDAVNYPKPLQKPYPPIYIGGEHERAVKFVAKHADVWNFPSDINPYTTAEYRKRVEILEEECDRIGRDPKTIRRSWLGISVIGRNEKEVKKRSKSLTNLNQEQLSREIVGVPEVCVQKIEEYLELGVSEFILIFPEKHEIESLHEFSREVINRF